MGAIDLKTILDIANRKKIYVVAIILICVFIGCLYTFKILKEEYKSSTTFLLGMATVVSEESTSPVIRTSIKIDSQTVATYSELIKSNNSLKEIKNNLKINMLDEDLKKSINITRFHKSDVIRITVSHTDKKMASDIANETVKVFSEKIKEIYEASQIYVVDVATPSQEPYNVNHVRDIVIFIVIGFLASFAYCKVISIFDKTVKSAETVEELGLRALTSIPNKKIKKQALEKLIDFQNEKSPVLQSFKTLRTNVQFANIHNKSNKVMLVTSCFSTEGKSYVAANLAAMFAQVGKKVIIIDMDMRAGRQANIFGTPNNLGIANYLSNLDTNGVEINERINSYIKETSIKNLNVITSGTVPPNTSDLLTSEKLPELIKDLSIFYDFIIFDGAPVLPVTDSLILTRMAGSTILVSLAHKTKKEDLIKAKKDLQNIGGRIVGVVLNEASIQNKSVKKAYFRLEVKKVKEDNEKFYKKIDIKNRVLKIKKWIINHIRKRHIPLLLEQKKEISEKSIDNELNQKKEKTSEINQEENNNDEIYKKIERKFEDKEKKLNEISEEIKEKKFELPINKIENTENKIQEENNEEQEELKKEQLENKIHAIKENITYSLKNGYVKMKDFFENIPTILGSFKEKIKKYSSERKKEKRKEKRRRNQKLQDKEINKTELIEKNQEKNDEINQENEIDENSQAQTEIYEDSIKENVEDNNVIEEKKRIEEEKEIQKMFLKEATKTKKMQEKEERRKRKEEKRKKQKQEARIQEELLEDNLYPKTKYNKNL